MATRKPRRPARRAQLYEVVIRDKQADGDYRGGLHEAVGWLLQEAAKVRRNRPADANAVDAAVTAKVAELAASIPDYKPSRGGRRVAS